MGLFNPPVRGASSLSGASTSNLAHPEIAGRSARKPKGEGHVRRAEILAAAERIFVEHGYEGATIRKIADEVGLSSTALYMHFAEKGEILHEICREAFEQLICENRAIAAVDEPAETKLRHMLEAYVRFGFSNPNAYRLIYLTRPVEARHGAQSAAQQMGAELFRTFEDLLGQLTAADRLRTDNARLAGQVFWAGAHGIVSLVITKPYFSWADRDLLTKTMIDTLLTGLIKP
jgi:AcrR family transcriptional regulator